MKKFLYLIISVIGLTFMSSCTKEWLLIITDKPEEYVNVPVDALLDGTHVICTKADAGSNDLWGIQIYKVDNPNFPEPYFCALYDDISLLTSVKFVKDSKYSIMANYMPNGKTLNENYGEYPGGFFECAPKSNVIELNQEYYGNSMYYNSLTQGVCTQFKIFTLEYYMSWMEDIVIDEKVKNLEIDFQRANCGIELNFECVGGLECNEVLVNIDGFEGRKLGEQRVELTDGKGRLSLPSITIDNHAWMGENKFNLKIGTSENKYVFYEGTVNLQVNKIRTYSVKLMPDNETDTNIQVTYTNTGELSNEDMGSLN